MMLGDLENKILQLAENRDFDLDKYEELFKQGANPNAICYDFDYSDIEKDGYKYYDTLFSACMDFISGDFDFLPLLKCFYKNGLDLNLYGPSIISDIHYSVYSKLTDFYEMIKFILNHMDKGISLYGCLVEYDMEESYYNCCLYDDYNSNKLASFCKLLNYYCDGKDYNCIFPWEKIIGQKVKKVVVSGKNSRVEDNVFFSSFNYGDMSTLIQCEKDSLFVLDDYDVYVDNYICLDNSCEEFSVYLTNQLKDEIVENVEFEHIKIINGNKSISEGRNVIISFSNNKKIIYRYIRDDKEYALIYVDTTNKNILEQYKDVFVEKEFNVIDKKYKGVKPDYTCKFRIFHNCDTNFSCRYKFSFLTNMDDVLYDDFIIIDEESFEILRPYVCKYIPEFDQYDSFNPIKAKTFNKLKSELLALIEDLKEDNITDRYKQCAYNSMWCYGGFDYNKEEYISYRFNDFKYDVIDFLNAFLWYITEFQSFSSSLDDKILNISGY